MFFSVFLSVSTACVLAELKDQEQKARKDDPKDYSGAAIAIKRMERRRCTHREKHKRIKI